MQGKPGAILAAWQTGQELGLGPMASLQSIAIINGRPSIHSAGYWALITSSPLCDWFQEDPPEQALKQGFGSCTIKRRGNSAPIARTFSLEEAKAAGLLSKDNWKLYPGVMLMQRARHRAGNDAIPEATQGLLPSDIAVDLEPQDEAPAIAGVEHQLQRPQPLPESTATEKIETNLRDAALELIASFTKETFPEASWLTPYLNLMKSYDDRLALTTAWDAKKKELEL